MRKKSVSFIIIGIEDIAALMGTISSVKKQSKYCEIEIVIAGDTSADPPETVEDNNTDKKEITKKEALFTLSADPAVKIINIAPYSYGAALHHGINAATCEYTAILNCGDKLDKMFAFNCLKVFDQKKTINIVAVNSFTFIPNLDRDEPSITNLDYSLVGSFIDLTQNPERVRTSINAALFKTDELKKLKIDQSLLYNQAGAKAIIDFQNKHKCVGFAKKGEYHFFTPQEDNALYHFPANHKDWYTESFEKFLLPILSQFEKLPPAFVQYFGIYHVQARFLSNLDNRNKNNMTSDELSEFFIITKQALQFISDDIILQKNRPEIIRYSMEASKMFLQLKYNLNEALPLNITQGNYELYLSYNNIHVYTMNSQRVSIHVMEYQQGKVVIDGSFREVFDTSILELYAMFNNKKYPLVYNDRYSLTKYFGVSAYKKFTFHCEFKLDEPVTNQTIAFYAKYKHTVVPVQISFIHHWAKLAGNLPYGYWRFNKYICTLEERALVIRKAKWYKTLAKELRHLFFVLLQSRKGFALRVLYWLTKPYFAKKKIWLMYDKMYKGGDSAEYLYRYSEKINDGITRYYIIDKDAAEYKKLKADGFKPVANKSLKHWMAFLNTDIALITNSHVFPFNGYNMERSSFIRDLCNFPSMCLQHGLTVQKCAMAQQRIIDNTRMYFIASKYEEMNLNHHAYNYNGFDIIKKTGIARYDGLINNDQKQILLSPTWRMYNAMPVTASEGQVRDYNPEFKNTLYYKIYNELINNEKLIETAKRTGYKIKYVLHPILTSQADDFTPNSEVEVIAATDVNYEKVFTESSLMVTDYSGVQFDFAYMKKPVVYFHSSQLPAHYEQGCFFYETMGFGEICTESEELVDLLCEYMANNCKMKQKYIDRVNDFYIYDDHNNCKRIYEQVYNFQKQIDKDKLRR